MAKDEISSLLKSVGVEKLSRSGIAWVDSADPQDVEMLLFIDEDGKRSLFLEVLRKVLVRGVTEASDTHEGEVVGRDLEKWFEKSPLEDPLVWWLKVEVERYPMRLFVVCDWRDFTHHTPDEDKFWFDLESDGKTTHIENDPRGTREIWSTRDARPWRLPRWRRFLGKRICWLSPRDVLVVLKKLRDRDVTGFFDLHLPGFEEEEGAEPWELFALWLRLKWVEHLACRVRGLDWTYRLRNGDWSKPYGALRVALGLGAAESPTSYRPNTLPPIDSAQGEEISSLSSLGGKDPAYPYLAPIQLGSSLKTFTSIELRWSGESRRNAYAILNIHRDVFEERSPGIWTGIAIDRAEGLSSTAREADRSGVLFSGALSGALLSHNTLSALSRDPRSQRAAWRFLDIAEHTLLRIAISDERVQTWWGRSKQAATSAIQRRVFPLFWQKVDAYKQGGEPNHKYWGLLSKVEDQWSVVLRGHAESPGQGFFHEVFADDPWPAAAEFLVIHQGILDKWAELDAVTPALILTDLKDEIPWLVVTSGRGRPYQIPPGVRFLPFSGLQACLVGDRCDKLLLVRQLMVCGGKL